MKTKFTFKNFKISFFTLALFLITITVKSQSDTLHLYYKGLQTALLDSNETKIGNWAKKLNGKHVNIEIISYYEKSEFKKYSETRADEALLIVNRKARELVTVNFSGPRKGEKSQRSTVDIVYTTGGASPVKTVEKEVKEKKENADKTKTEVKEKVAQEKKEKKEDAKEKKKEVEKKVEEKKEVVKEKTTEKNNVLYDTSYVNGEMTLTKKYDPNYRYDTVYVNGEIKVTKRKIKKK